MLFVRPIRKILKKNLLPMSTQEIADQYKKALRRMNNAKEILSAKVSKEDDVYYRYQDAKYVKKACKVAYNAALIALKAYLEMKGKTVNGKPDLVNLNDYRWVLNDDTGMFNDYNNAWNVLYCAGYHNGNLNSYMIASGMESGDAIINAIRPAD